MSGIEESRRVSSLRGRKIAVLVGEFEVSLLCKGHAARLLVSSPESAPEERHEIRPLSLRAWRSVEAELAAVERFSL